MIVAIIGAGIAGASLAFELSEHVDVILIEREDQPGYHTTGRSAAVYAKSYGNAAIRRLTVASEGFYTTPPKGFTDQPLLQPRGAFFVAREDQDEALQQLFDDISEIVPAARIVDAAEARQIVPILRTDYVARALIERDSRDMDVGSILQGYLRGAAQRGARRLLDHEVTALERRDGRWSITAGNSNVEADVVVNAAGAWADTVAALAGLGPFGITPKRRTAFLVRAPGGVDHRSWPVTIDVEETFYFKPDAGMILASPADETPMAACDVQPDDLDIAIAVDRIQKVAELPVQSIGRSWAGLRSFAADKTPVLGFDPRIDGFCWLAGQGGYGIQTGPAMGKLAAHVISGCSHGLDIDTDAALHDLRPDRLISVDAASA